MRERLVEEPVVHNPLPPVDRSRSWSDELVDELSEASGEDEVDDEAW